jgi:cytochrome c-type biogenesis protein
LLGGYTLSKQIRSYRMYIKKVSGIALVLIGLWMIF